MNSTLNPDNEPSDPDDDNASRGRDGRALGPSDSSDSGSDTAGARRYPFDVDSPLDESMDIKPDRAERLSEPGRTTEPDDQDEAGDDDTP
ncbi:chemotaxis protein [Burkholderia sp. HI2714]|uniref:chemotaxis protein n=1 Tax=Burkholderia sp. HI2714 TaxID=2015359 RepID=UPI000B7A3ADB|nr:chemotaxis protein [Burkholderia sp. HI2714]OXJ25726.1 chemotaxis protein [Burkholderia sp. HI2714]